MDIGVVDTINGLFECLGGWFVILSIMKLQGEKRVHGVSWLHAGFFTVWGYWNLYFYPQLGQWFSFLGGIVIVVMNTLWMIQLIHYSRKQLIHDQKAKK